LTARQDVPKTGVWFPALGEVARWFSAGLAATGVAPSADDLSARLERMPKGELERLGLMHVDVPGIEDHRLDAARLGAYFYG